jgi:hypothetical protein
MRRLIIITIFTISAFGEPLTRSQRNERQNRFCNCPTAFARILLIDNALFRNTSAVLGLTTTLIRRGTSGLLPRPTTLSFAISLIGRSKTFLSTRIRRGCGKGKLSTVEHSILYQMRINAGSRSVLQRRNTFGIMRGLMHRRN